MCFKMLEKDYFGVTKNYLQFYGMIKALEEKTTWLKMPISDLKISDVDKEKIRYNGISNIAAENYSLEDKELKIYDGAIKTLLDRARIGGSALGDLLPEVFANLVNECFAVGKGDTIINIVDDSLCAAHSDNYVILALSQVFNSANEHITKTVPTAKFFSGGVSIGYAFADYDLSEDTRLAERFEKIYSKVCGLGKMNFDVKPMVRYTSSNTGDSGANIFPFLYRKYDNKRISFPVGKPITLDHKGDCSIIKYKENLQMLFGVFEESVETFAKMSMIKIKFPVSCLLNVAKRIGMPKKLAIQASEDFAVYVGNGFSNAQDVYFGLTEILNYIDTSDKGEKYMLTVQEIVGRALALDFSEYDTKSCDWLQNSVSSENAGQLFGIAS